MFTERGRQIHEGRGTSPKAKLGNITNDDGKRSAKSLTQILRMVEPRLLRQMWNDRRDGSHEHSQGLARHLHRGQSRWRRRLVAVESVFGQVAIHWRHSVRQKMHDHFIHVVMLVIVVQTLNLRTEEERRHEYGTMLSKMFQLFLKKNIALRNKNKDEF